MSKLAEAVAGLTSEEARADLRLVSRQALDPHLWPHEPHPQVVHIRTAMPGYGKTHREMHRLRESGESFAFFSPSTAKMNESLADLQSAGSDAVGYYGLLAPDPVNPHDFMCKFHEPLELIQASGSDVSKACFDCPLLETCRRGQTLTHDGPIDHITAPHILIGGGMKAPLRPTYENIVIDEDPLPSLQQQRQFKVGTLRAAMAAIPRTTQQRHDNTDESKAPLDEAYDATRALHGYLFGVHRRTFGRLMVEIERVFDAPDENRLRRERVPSITDLDGLNTALLYCLKQPFGAAANREPDAEKMEQLKKRAEENAAINRARDLISVIIESMRKMRRGDHLPGIYIGSLIHTAAVSRIDVGLAPGRNPVILSATPSDEILYRHVWADVEFDHLQEMKRREGEAPEAWKRRVYGGTHYVRVPVPITAARMGVETDKRPPLFEQVLAFIRARVGELPVGKRLLLVCNVNIFKKLEPELPAEVDHENFRGVQGKNKYADGHSISHPIQIVLGRPEPPVFDKLLIAEVYAGQAIELEVPAHWQRRETWENGRDGTSTLLEMPGHENPYLDALIRQVTQTAVTQADRSRSFHRKPGEATVYFVGQVPAAQGYDEVMQLDATGVAIEAMVAKGVIPMPGKRPPYQTYALLRGWGTGAGERARKLFRYHGDDLNEKLADHGGDGWSTGKLKVPNTPTRQVVQIAAPAGAEARAVIEALVADGTLPEGTTYHFTRRKKNAAT